MATDETKNTLNSMFDDDVFDGLDEVEVFDKLPWFEANHTYKVEIDGVKMVHSDTKGIPFYIIECLILESTCPELPAGMKAARILPIRPDRISRTYFKQELKQFISAVLGLSREEQDGFAFQEMNKAIVTEGVFNGRQVRIKTSLNKNGFTNYNYSHVNES